MIVAIIGILFGGFSGTMIQKQIAFCECKRDDFKGAYCQSIKADSAHDACAK